MIQKSQFAMYTYGWQSAQLGPYMSIMAFTRGFVLVVLLPGTFDPRWRCQSDQLQLS